MCLDFGFWNKKDPMIKERIFGLTAHEGNHGEDCKELYYYLDATPTHSYLKMLYKYPQREFPYASLVEENGRRGKDQPEFELLDTGIFDDDRYFDVFVEYAKAAPEDILMLVTIHNRGPESAPIHVLPQLWFRNTWSWKKDSVRPVLQRKNVGGVIAKHAALGDYHFYCDENPRVLFCENETNPRRIFNQPDAQGYFKDAFHDFVINGNDTAINPDHTGTKTAAHYKLQVPARGSTAIRIRLANRALTKPFGDFNAIFDERRCEADDFYAAFQQDLVHP